jgi:hypothetical protein
MGFVELFYDFCDSLSLNLSGLKDPKDFVIKRKFCAKIIGQKVTDTFKVSVTSRSIFRLLHKRI